MICKAVRGTGEALGLQDDFGYGERVGKDDYTQSA